MHDVALDCFLRNHDCFREGCYGSFSKNNHFSSLKTNTFLYSHDC